MSISRRETILGLTSAACCGLPSISLSEIQVDLTGRTIESISDGNLTLPGTTFFEGLPKDELAVILSKHGVTTEQLKPQCNLTLLRDGDRTALFDAGSGNAFMPTAGKMLDSLDTIGLTAEDITHVVFTHAHPDHLWGILDDFDDLVFPNAELMIGQVEWKYWTDPDTVRTVGETRASFAVGAARRLAAIKDQISFIEDGQEVLPGVMAHATPGHTPGHMSFEVRDGSEALMILGDAVINHHIALARPEWPSGSDQDTEMGAQTRLRILDQVATDKIPVLGFHLPNGGLGRIERYGDGYRFEPEVM